MKQYKLVAHQRDDEPTITSVNYEDVKDLPLYSETKSTFEVEPLSWIEVDGVSMRITRTYNRFARWVLKTFFKIIVRNITD